jgi:hypothetical protein
MIIKADPNINVVKWIQEQKKNADFDLTTINWPDLLQIEYLTIDDKEPVRVQQEAFLGAVADKQLRPEVSVEEGLAALQCAQEILNSIKKHKWKEKIADST